MIGAGRKPIEDSPPSAGRLRRGDPWRTAFFAVAGLAIIVGVGWALLGSSLLVVRSVAVAGTHLVSRSAVLRAAAIQPGTPLIRVNPAAVARRVERITQVRSARVRRDWPDSVLIAVTERSPALAVRDHGRYALIDGSGVIVRWVARRPSGMPLLDRRTAAGGAVAAPGAGLAALRGSPAVQAAATVLGALPPRLRGAVRSVSAPSSGAVTLHDRDGITVVWGGTGRPAAKAAELAILIRTGASYYDVSDPGSAVTRG